MLNIVYVDTLQEAWQEAARRKQDPTEEGNLVKVDPSGYGGYKVYSIPAELFVDSFDEPGSGGLWSFLGPRQARKRA